MRGIRNYPPDRNELYTRAFVKEFGASVVGLPLSEARSSAITIITSTPTPVTILAEVAGQRFKFAALSNVNGTQPIVVNIPKTVNELIVLADDMEYTIPVGSVLDLTKAASRSVTVTNNGVTIVYDSEANRTVTFNGSSMKGSCCYFNPEDGCAYLGDFAIESSKMYCCPEYYPFNDATKKWFNVFPLYWRKDGNGNKDYVIGVYGFSVTDHKYEDIVLTDLDLDVSKSIWYKKPGDSEWQQNDGDDAFDYASVTDSWQFKVEGAHLDFPDFEFGKKYIGFYVKTGVKETITDENFGRDCDHISFTQPRYNAQYWDENSFWNLKLKDIQFCYAGAAAFGGSTLTINTRNPFTSLDDYGETYTGGYALGFMSEPQGHTESNPDFSDCILLICTPCGAAREIVQPGTEYQCFPWYIAAEDLGGSYDWDFNDLVVTVYDITTDYAERYAQANGDYPSPSITARRIIVYPSAAGGTMPIYLMYQGQVSKAATKESYLYDILNGTFKEEATYIVGTEMHRWLGADSHSTPLNVFSDTPTHSGRAVSFSIPVNLDQVDPSNPPKDLGEDNTPLYGFWVMVDSKDEMQYYNSVNFNPAGEEEETENGLTPFAGTLGDGTYSIHKPNEDRSDMAPQMLICHYSWYWPREGENIAEAWTWFRDWVNGTRKVWHVAENTTENPPYNAEKVCRVTPPSHME